jgi:hypothetical protein
VREHDIYIVQPSEAGWAVRLNDETLGVFHRRPEAIEAAVVVAEASGRAGRTSGVLSEQNGEYLSLWQVGQDAYSPRA